MFSIVLIFQHHHRPPRNSRGGMCQGGDGVLQTLCGEFDSHPLQNFSEISSWGRTSALGAECGRFESFISDHILHRSKAVMQRAVNSPIAGSSPADAATGLHSLMVRPPAHDGFIDGSNPSGAINEMQKSITQIGGAFLKNLNK